MKEIKPVYLKALVVVIVLYVIGVCLIQNDLQIRVGNIEHALMHMGGACGHLH